MEELTYFQKAKETARNFAGDEDFILEPLPLSGSARRYFRMRRSDSSVIICVSDNIKENTTFISLTRYLEAKGIPVATILYVARDASAYILHDLGSTDFLRFIHSHKEAGDEEAIRTKIKEIVRYLVKFQRLPEEEWSELVEFPPFDENLIEFDLKYCIDNFFEATGVNYNREALRGDFKKLECKLMSFPKQFWGLMYRDFQSRNIMMAPSPYFIDYQSARFGPGIYDLVSFAWQAKAGFSNETREEIVEIYVRMLGERGIDGETVRKDVYHWALFRIIQTLGAYGLRGLKEGKPHFIQSIPPAINNLKELLEHNLSEEYPHLQRVINFL